MITSHACVDGQRGGPVVTYLAQALRRPNFHLQSETHVVRVERDGEQATGVTVLINGAERLIKISQTGRVVLSAGALVSPSLLMSCGIGPADQLSALASAGRLALDHSGWINSTAVGDGLFDNPNTFIELRGDKVESYSTSYNTPVQEEKDLYLKHRSGPYTFAGQTSVFWDTITHPDGNVTTFQGTVGTAGFGEYTDANTITLNIYGTSGLRSHGHVVHDASHIPGASPGIFYSDPQDAADIAGFIHKIFQGLPAAGLTPLNIAQDSTVEEIKSYITSATQYTGGVTNHWSSSCRIGKCVDANTAVIGTKNLHVVDASIVAPLSVNPQFGVMIAAERASELILALEGHVLL